MNHHSPPPSLPHGTRSKKKAADVEVLRRISENLAAEAPPSAHPTTLLSSPTRVAIPGAADLHIHRCVLSARSPFMRAARRLVGEEVEVGKRRCSCCSTTSIAAASSSNSPSRRLLYLAGMRICSRSSWVVVPGRGADAPKVVGWEELQQELA